MKNTSVKLRITALLTVLTALLSLLMLAFMLSISSTVAERAAREQLWQTMRSNVGQIEITGGSIDLGPGFHFYQSGVSMLIYSRSKTLLAGQVPVSFVADEPFESGLIRPVISGGEQYLLLDIWAPSGWEDGVWVRGLMEAPESGHTARNLLRVAVIAMPAFILLAALGGYLILRRAFRPLEGIISTASAINEAKDLSLRIGLPEGQDEFSRLGHAFDRLFERLERSFEAEKRFTADASHELRTPVSIIKGACEYALKYDETPQERRESIEMVHRQAEKMSLLISRLLSMTRLEQGTEMARMERLDLGLLARSFCMEQSCGRLTPEIEQGLEVSADPTLIGRLLQNLVDNAFKYGKPDGRVWVSAFRQGNEAVLSVRDDGIGIEPRHQQLVWQRFYQVDPSRSGEGGTGLGLSMVRQIAELHGGYMTLESLPGVGSCFSLHLPLKRD